MNIAMGIISLPSIKDYWSSNPILRHNWFSTVMSRKRFLEILRFFHIVDNTTAPSRSDPNYNRLWKIQPIISILQDTCGELYSPHEQLSIDESMIGTKCRLSFIQYIKVKPVKWGIKVWICSDSTNGYISSFDVYTGKDPAKPLHSHGLAHGVVLSLLDKFLGKGYTVYTDNFYTSPLLCEDLLQKGIFSCGTVRTNKKQFPKLLIDKSKKLNRGEYIFCHHGHVTAVKWQDRREVYAMCTKVTNDVTQVKRRNSDGPGRIDVPCPKMIEQYNKFMGRVDLADQKMCYYSIGRKNMKWWRKVVWRLHDHAITNAYVIYKENNSHTMGLTNLQFRLKLAEAMTESLMTSRVIPTRPPVTTEMRLTGKHFPYRSTHRRRCAVCAYKKSNPNGKSYRGTKTHYWCFKCEKHLCVGKCFELYHSRTYYRNY